jgi:adenosylmethionine-8-amino-7-oxononanoate aminotransferase
LREVCDRYGVLLILDEVMCGMGRTGTLLCQRAGRRGAGSGHHRQGPRRRLSAGRRGAGCQRKIVEAMSQGSGFFQHGHTYLGHPVACAAALAVQEVIHRDGLLAKVRADGEAFGAMLREMLGAHPNVGDIRGRGFFWGVELVADSARARRLSRRR